MKIRKIIGFTSLLITVMILAALAGLFRPFASAKTLAADTIYQQSTPTPAAEDVSEIGSTDGIFIMGGVILLIVTVPVLYFRKKV